MAREAECLDGPEDCSGAVLFRIPLSPSGRSFARCDKHWADRLDQEAETVRKYGSWQSDVPPDWFDPAYAGERWNEE
jgi:hypothetical protein